MPFRCTRRSDHASTAKRNGGGGVFEVSGQVVWATTLKWMKSVFRLTTSRRAGSSLGDHARRP